MSTKKHILALIRKPFRNIVNYLRKKPLGNLRSKLFSSSIALIILIPLIAFVLLAIFIVWITITKTSHGYNRSFLDGILVEAHGLVLDLLIVGILILYLSKIIEKKIEINQSIERYKDEIDDLRLWKSEEAVFKIVGNIKRLNRYNILAIDLRHCYLRSARLYNLNLKESNLSYADLQGANLDRANLQKASMKRTDLRNATLRRAIIYRSNLNGINLAKADLSGANLNETRMVESSLIGELIEIENIKPYVQPDLSESILINTSFCNAIINAANFNRAIIGKKYKYSRSRSGPNLRIADFSEADLSYSNLINIRIIEGSGEDEYIGCTDVPNSEGIIVEALSKARTLYRAEFDESIKRIINEKYPHLLSR